MNLPASAASFPRVRLLRGFWTFFLPTSGKASGWSRAFACRLLPKLAQSQAFKARYYAPVHIHRHTPTGLHSCIGIRWLYRALRTMQYRQLSSNLSNFFSCLCCMLQSASSLWNMPEAGTNSFILLWFFQFTGVSSWRHFARMIEDFTLMHFRWKPLGEQAREGGQAGRASGGNWTIAWGEWGEWCEWGKWCECGEWGECVGWGEWGEWVGASGASSKCDATPLEDLFICTCSAIQSCRKTKNICKFMFKHAHMWATLPSCWLYYMARWVYPSPTGNGMWRWHRSERITWRLHRGTE